MSRKAVSTNQPNHLLLAPGTSARQPKQPCRPLAVRDRCLSLSAGNTDAANGYPVADGRVEPRSALFAAVASNVGQLATFVKSTVEATTQDFEAEQEKFIEEQKKQQQREVAAGAAAATANVQGARPEARPSPRGIDLPLTAVSAHTPGCSDSPPAVARQPCGGRAPDVHSGAGQGQAQLSA